MATDRLSLTTDAVGDATTLIPPLEPGDRLSRAEFERRYRAMPQLKKAELIEGVVFMPSPVRLKRHAEPHSNVVGWLFLYKAGTPSVETGDNCTVRLDLNNEPQPDAMLYIEPDCGGQVRISEDDHVEQAPELVVEVASSSASYDLGPKLDAYHRNGVREYIVWRVLDGVLDWFVLRDSEYRQLQPSDDGLLRSLVFPGLWLDAKALLGGRYAEVVQTLQTGLLCPEHAAFVERLAAFPSS